MRLFSASDDEIRNGDTADVYFQRTKQILDARNVKAEVWAEFTAGSLPRNWEWAVFCGTEEVMRLMEGTPVDIHAVPEGTVFVPRNGNGVRIPLMNIHGEYREFGELETAALGMVCHPSGVATASSRVKIAASGKKVIAFGNRRMHPAVSGVLDRSAFIGGCDAVSSKIGGQMTGTEPIGTVPHSLMLLMGSNDVAFKAFDEVIDDSVPRIMLIDTFTDERAAAIEACRSVKELKGIRLDTPGSRRGNFRELVQEVRWELDMNGFSDVEIIASGGLDEDSIKKIADAPVSTFGVGTSISNAPTLDISMDIVEKDGKQISKRGKFGGRKYTFRCPHCLAMDVSLSPDAEIRCGCGSSMEMIERRIMKNGKRMSSETKASDIREYVLRQLEQIAETSPKK